VERGRKDMTATTRERKAAVEPLQREVPGIIIRDWTPERGEDRLGPRVRAFVYGEKEPSLPTLPFGRWRTAG
jgi:hypothetical protein